MLSRRDFLQQAAVCGAATVIGSSWSGSLDARSVQWPIGCFNRPWTGWSFDDALKQITQAGYKTMGLLTRTKEEAFIGADATPEYLARLKQRIADAGLTANMGALRSRHNIPLEDSIREVRKQIDNASGLALTYLLTFGVDRPEEYDHYYKVMSDAAAYASDKKLKLVMKPHGGNSGASDDIQAVMKAVNHPNFKIWYRRRQHHLLHGQGSRRGAQADRAPRHRVLCQGLRRRQERGHDPVWNRQGGFRGRLRDVEVGGIRRPDHGRVLQNRHERRRDGRERASEPRVPRASPGENCITPCKRTGHKDHQGHQAH